MVEMGRGAFIGLALAMGAPVFAAAAPLASNDVACVQKELTTLGLYHGQATGTLTRKTLTAARTYQQAAVYLVDLDADSARVWCKALQEAVAQRDQPNNPEAAAVGVPEEPETPILGVTSEYQVPAWVNNPH
jgi:hypothetical protein